MLRYSGGKAQRDKIGGEHKNGENVTYTGSIAAVA
jgi:hypothetical protein